MSKKEIITNENENILTAKQEQKKKSLVNAYFKALETFKKSAWATAKAVHDCLENKEIFPTAQSVAIVLQLDKSTVSKLSKAYDLKAGLQMGYDTVGSDLTSSQVQELLPLYDGEKAETIDVVAECIVTEKITANDKTKEVRAKVKEFMNKETTEETTEETAEETAEEKEEVKDVVAYFRYMIDEDSTVFEMQEVRITREVLEKICNLLSK